MTRVLAGVRLNLKNVMGNRCGKEKDNRNKNDYLKRKMNICIFCKSDSSNSKGIEHIIPESMGCPENFYLKRGVVCDSCNNNILSALDSSLQDSFGIIRPFYIMKNKKGSPLRVRNKFLLMENNSGHMTVHINRKGRDVKLDDGRFLKSIEKKGSSIRFCEKYNEDGTVSFNIGQDLVFNSKAKRAFHKIAFEFLCWVQGVDVVLNKKFDDLREYVLKGVGDRSVLMGPKVQIADEQGIHEFKSISLDKEGNMIVPFNLFNFSFIVQLTGNLIKLEEIKNKSNEFFDFEYQLI